MHLAIWDHPVGDFLVSRAQAEALPLMEVSWHDAGTCEALLEEGLVDVAMLPALTVLLHTDQYDVLPGVAFSSWKYPFAVLALKKGLAHPTRQVAFNPAFAQEAFVARVVLGEHYGSSPDFVASVEGSKKQHTEEPEDAALLVENRQPLISPGDAIMLDLGQEWFELTNYPMVWGLFAVRKEEGSPQMIQAMLDLIAEAERLREEKIQEMNSLSRLETFITDDLRIRLDDLAVASLTELSQYMFYYKLVDEVPDLPLIAIKDEEYDGEEDEDMFL